MNLSRLFAVAVTVTTLLSSAATSQTSDTWEPENSTPGVELEFVEVGGMKYKLRGKGLPSDKSYTLWQRWQDGYVESLGPAVRIDESGYIIWGPSSSLELITESIITLENFGRGEGIEAALISHDKTVMAFARVIPNPAGSLEELQDRTEETHAAKAAGEWKEQSYRDSIIELRSDWYWATPERGEFIERQLGDLNPHQYSAAWGSWPAPRLQILVERLAPGLIWTSGPPTLDKDYLEGWYELSDAGVSEVEEAPCDARQCVTFKADGIYNCGALLNYASSWENWTDGVSADASDVVMAYFCIGQELQVTTSHLDKILASIVIRDDDSGKADSLSGPSHVDQSDEAVVENLKRYAALLRETGSNAWPPDVVIDEVAENLRKGSSGETPGSIYLGIDPSGELRKYAALLHDLGRAVEAKEMEALADFYRVMQIRNVNSRGVQVMDMYRYYAPEETHAAQAEENPTPDPIEDERYEQSSSAACPTLDENGLAEIAQWLALGVSDNNIGHLFKITPECAKEWREAVER